MNAIHRKAVDRDIGGAGVFRADLEGCLGDRDLPDPEIAGRRRAVDLGAPEGTIAGECDVQGPGDVTEGVQIRPRSEIPGPPPARPAIPKE